MAVLLMGFLLLLAIAGHSSGATYCLCKDGLSDSVLQKNIDYACGNGADCTPIHQGSSCYNPNTVKDHCNYAVNSYFQRKGQATGSCDFMGTATPSSNPPTPSSGCVYPSSSSGGGSTTPGTGTGTSTGTGTIVPPGGTTPFPGLTPGPAGGISNPDGSGSGRSLHQSTSLFYSSLILTLSVFRLDVLQGLRKMW